MSELEKKIKLLDVINTLIKLKMKKMKINIKPFHIDYGITDTNETLLLFPTSSPRTTSQPSLSTSSSTSARPSPSPTPDPENCSDEVKRKCYILREPVFSKVSVLFYPLYSLLPLEKKYLII